LDWAAKLLIAELKEGQNNQTLISAINAISEIEFRPGDVLNSAQHTLSAVASRTRRVSLTSIVHFKSRQQVRSAIGKAITKISAYEIGEKGEPAG